MTVVVAAGMDFDVRSVGESAFGKQLRQANAGSKFVCVHAVSASLPDSTIQGEPIPSMKHDAFPCWVVRILLISPEVSR